MNERGQYRYLRVGSILFIGLSVFVALLGVYVYRTVGGLEIALPIGSVNQYRSLTPLPTLVLELYNGLRDLHRAGDGASASELRLSLYKIDAVLGQAMDQYRGDMPVELSVLMDETASLSRDVAVSDAAGKLGREEAVRYYNRAFNAYTGLRDYLSRVSDGSLQILVGLAGRLSSLRTVLLLSLLFILLSAALTIVLLRYQRLTLAALEASRTAAVAATRAKSAFLSTMTHELRTPLNAVLGMTSLLSETPLDREQAEWIVTIRQSGEALLSTINEILDFSKIEAGRLDLESVAFSVRTCAESAVDLVAPQATAKHLELTVSVDLGGRECVVGDATRLRQVLVNLLGNAVKFTDSGEIGLTVSADDDAGDAAAGRRVRFEVRDTGLGIRPEFRERMFQSFEQADGSTTRKYGGTGLGLAISRRIVEMMGGTIEVDSEGVPGRGSTFRFSIVAPPAPDGSCPEPAAPPRELAGLAALVLDDNDTNRLILARTLGAWGMRPTPVGSPRDALRMIREGARFELAIVDYHMPGMDGLEFAREARRAHGSTPLPTILLTSLGQRPDDRAVDAALSKPVKPSVLLEIVSGLVAGAPRTTGARSAKPSEPAVPAHIVVAPQAAPFRLLLAEDNLINQKVAMTFLQRMGWRCDVAANGLEVLDALGRQRYDIVLMDVMMPEMDGLEAARAIRAAGDKYGRPVIVAMTAQAMAGDIEACSAAGMDDYLVKPVEPEKLKATLDRWSTRLAADAGSRADGATVSPALAGFDTADGLARAGGDPVLYLDLLRDFAQTYRTTAANIRRLVESGDRAGARFAAHELRGVAGNLSAVKVFKAAAGLEDALRRDADRGAADTAAYAVYLDALDEALPEACDSVDGTLASG